MLEYKNLHVSVEGTEILQGVDLTFEKGKVNAIMGPNGSGKSTLARVTMGHPDYEITSGEILYDGQDVTGLEPEERAQAGLFVSFQYPVEIPGVNNAEFLRMAYNAKAVAAGGEELDAFDFDQKLTKVMAEYDIPAKFKDRGLNEGFSGGEKKRNEILQMAILEPTIAILDETDSGLDIDALRVVADGINHLRSAGRGIVLITHYQRLLDYVEPDNVHVMVGGRVVKSGGKELATILEEEGYEPFLAGATAGASG